MSDVRLAVDVAPTVALTVTDEDAAALTFGGTVFSPEVYRGAYIVTPAGNEQVLATAGMALEHDVVVAPIPDNYGLVTYNGTSLRIS